MPKATHGMPVPQPVPKRPHLALLPSGRFFEFGNVIDAQPTGDTFTVVQAIGNGERTTEFIGEDARAALQIMQGIMFIHLGSKQPAKPGIEIARQMPQVATR